MAGSFNTRLGTSPEEGIKAPVVAATSVNILLNGQQTIGAVDVVAGDRVLVAAQSTPAENGIYDVATAAWSRSTDFNAAEDVVNGVLVLSTATSQIHQAAFVGPWEPGITEVLFPVILNTGGGTDGFIPLSGTVAGSDITGNLLFGNTSISGKYSLNHVDFGGIGNGIGFYSEYVNSFIQMQTRNSGGESFYWTFGASGGMSLPATSENGIGSWNMKGTEYFGVETLVIGGELNAGGTASWNVSIFTDPLYTFTFQNEGYLVLPRHPDAGTGDFAAVTKKYVDDLLGPTAGESNTTSNQGGGVEIAMPKVAVDLPFRTLAALDSNTTVALNGTLIDIGVVPGPVFDNLGVVNGIIADNIATQTSVSTAGTLHADGEVTSNFPTSGGDLDTLTRKDYVDLGVALLAGAEITAGDGLAGGGRLDSNPVLQVNPGFGLGFNAGALEVNKFEILDRTTLQENITGVKSFDVAPQSTVNPVTGNDLCRKDYVDLAVALVAGATITAGDGLTGGGTVDSNPTLEVNAGYGLGFNAGALEINLLVTMDVGTDQFINSLKTFNTAPRATVDPVNGNDLARKSYVDSVAGGGNYVTLTGNQSIGGVKTFTSVPQFNAGAGFSAGIIGTTVSLSGGASSGFITSGGAASTLARKDYVDFVSSDARWKEDITETHGDWAVGMLTRIEPVEFNWRDDAPKAGHAYGFIAQEVQREIPGAVHEFDDGMLGVDLSQMVGILWAQNKELLRRIEELESNAS